MVLSGQTLRELKIISPFREKYKVGGVSGGVSHAGYDIALAQDIEVPANGFVLASSQEYFDIPQHIVGAQHDKSTWARLGIAVKATVLEPGWKGYLTIELFNHGNVARNFLKGTPIAQILFHTLDRAVAPYKGKYQNQGSYPQPAIFEE